MAAGGRVVCPLFGVVFYKLSSLIQTELGPLWGVEKELKKLYKIFCRIKHVLSDAEEKQFKEEEEAIRLWLHELNEAAYMTDDVFDVCEYESQQLASEEMNSSIVTESPKEEEVNICHKIRKDIGKLITTFQEIAEEIPELDLQKGKAEKRVEEICPGRETSSLLTEPQVYGRDEDKEKLVKILLGSAYLPLHRFHLQHRHPNAQNIANNSQEDLSICPILGVGGLGKTTLAQLVYNDERVAKHFDVRSWICVSTDFGFKRLIKAILESLLGYTPDSEELEPLQRRLKEKLHGQKFLLVLDDVWEENQNELEKMKGLLRCGAKGSSVMVTTRLETVASLIGTIPSCRPKVLSKDDCWSLFKQRAFESKNEETPVLVQIGKEIVNKCGGLPLAAKALGGLLRFKREENEWLAVQKSEVWELPQSSENYILPALRLSYYHLPLQLRQCFVYCSIFPKDNVIYREELIQLWVANSLVQTSDKMELEDAGNEVFNALLHRSLFQDAKKDDNGSIETCKMHDLVHDLASYVAGDEYSIVGSVKYIGERTRHASISSASSSTEVSPSSMLKFKERSSPCLRSLITLSYWRSAKGSKYIFSHFSCLRALDMKGRYVKSIPNSVSKMMNLRYFNLSYTKIRFLPESICLLRNLQTLKLIKCTELELLPKDMRKMSSLRYLDIRGCRALTSMPAELRQLSCLHTLSTYIVCPESGCGVDELQGLNNRGGILEIKGLVHVKTSMEAREAKLINMKNLRFLALTWSSRWKPTRSFVSGPDLDFELEQHEQQNAPHEEVIEGLQPHPNLRKLLVEGYGGVTCSPIWSFVSVSDSNSELEQHEQQNAPHEEVIEGLQPHPNLRKLLVEGYGGGACSPSWLTAVGVPNLVEIKLHDCRRCERLPPLGKLGSLKVLDLRKMDSLKFIEVDDVGASVVGGGGFPALEEIGLYSMPNLEGWSPLSSQTESQVAVFPCLKKVTLQKCPQLKGVPLSWSPVQSVHVGNCNGKITGSLRDLPSLVYLQIVDCYELEYFPTLQNLTALQTLTISSCDKLKVLHVELKSLFALTCLNIDSCKNLASLALRNSSLKTLVIKRCYSLKQLALRNLSSLNTLVIENCCSLKHLPQLDNTSLVTLRIIDCLEMKLSNEDFEHLVVLEDLELRGLRKLTSFPEGIKYSPMLRSLEIVRCNNVVDLPHWIGTLTSLKKLAIGVPKNWTVLPWLHHHRVLPHWMQHLTALQELRIYDDKKLFRRWRSNPSTTST